MHVVDHEDVESSLAGGELVLSSGVSLGHNLPLQREIFPIMQRQSIAGLVLAIGPYLPEVPAAMVVEADRFGIPLVALPWEVNFREVTYALLTRLVREQYRLLEEVESLNRELLGLLLRRGDLAAFCDRTTEITGRPAAILDPSGRCRAQDAQSSRDGAWGTAAAEVPAGLDRIAPFRDRLGRPALISPIVIAGRRQGYLVLGTGAVEPERYDAMVAETATISAALLIAQNEEVERARSARERDALLALFEGSAAPEQVASLGLGAGPYAVAVCVSGADDTESALALLRRTLAAEAPRARLSARGREVVMLLPAPRRGGWRGLCRELADVLGAAGFAPRIGLSVSFPAPSTIPAALAEARDALRLGTRLDPDGMVHAAEESVALRQVARTLAETPGAASRIDALAEHDEKHKAALVETLDVWLRFQRNAADAARALGIHRHTLSYRLERIAAILATELSDEVCFDLRLQLLAHRLRR